MALAVEITGRYPITYGNGTFSIVELDQKPPLRIAVGSGGNSAALYRGPDRIMHLIAGDNQLESGTGDQSCGSRELYDGTTVTANLVQSPSVPSGQKP